MNIGDRVKLRSGGPLMTVVAIGDKTALTIFHSGEVQCSWFSEDGSLHASWFNVATLLPDASASNTTKP